jgi:phosphomannomutase
MAPPPQKLSQLTDRALELLELLADSPHGATEALLVHGYGFDIDMIAELVRAGFATAGHETIKAGARPIEVVRVRITDTGHSAIEE